LDPGFDVIVLGRVEVEFFPDMDVSVHAGAERFVRTVRGGGGGVALAAARLGMRCALISRVGDDVMGQYARSVLEASDLAHLWLGIEPGTLTPVVFHEAHPAWGRHWSYGEDPARTLSLDDLDLDIISSARLLWTTGVGLAWDPERAATLAALDARSNVGGGIAVHRLDLRPELFGGEEQARECNREALRHVTATVGGARDAQALTGLDDVSEASKALVDLGLDLVVIRLDPGGALARTRSGVVEIMPVETTEHASVDGAFDGALCLALISGWDAERALRYAVAAGVLAASHPLGEMPTLNDIESTLARNPANG
jgi:5-dehydro-2-deoxygluconokinase